MLRRFVVFVVAVALVAPTARAMSETEKSIFLTLKKAAYFAKSENTARGSYDTCLDVSKQLAQTTEDNSFWRLYSEAMISKCVAFAMGSGGFTDKTGDACSHAYIHTLKVAEIAARIAENPEFMDNSFLDDVESFLNGEFEEAIRIGSNLNCTQDFKALMPK
jgi:hypothetical protein